MAERREERRYPERKDTGPSRGAIFLFATYLGLDKFLHACSVSEL